ncbi:hypothetical protein BDZ90DRAFT_246736 [Jaminaea rosea]|uniref:C2H2-type domain-containing protein n=1 Tax=Jaminaea rosea TaxID=1569628 RepID=A0A316UT14_9BASI|nr:hypothetical protein BDZ90DRAFT_246736 [Jaminaea rosea]PWN26275.1 hypothetical protein BDZ90DRAFT_246736 [Jaminaea rosea]
MAGASQLYTCMSCLVGFHSPLDQRTHYRSDLHRYNMKRQVAGLPPVRQDVFEQKVQQRQPAGNDAAAASKVSFASTSQAESSQQRPRCQQCSKSFASPNAFTTHLNSRKHKETAAKNAAHPSVASAKASVNPPATTGASDDPLVFRVPASAASALSGNPSPLEAMDQVKQALPNTASVAQGSADAEASSSPFSSATATASTSKQPLVPPTSLTLSSDASDAEIEAAISARLSSATRIDPAKTCIFCPPGTPAHNFPNLEASLAHMQKAHGFFIPERTYLVDLPGLAQYLADKVSVGHMCLYCNGRGRGFSTAEAARKHMVDKNHCKIAYDAEEDKMELSDFYDFTSSYPDAGEEKEEAEWEDMDASDGEDGADDAEMEKDDEESLPANTLRYGDSELELVLPSGARLGHRSLARYYRQTLFSTPASASATDRSGGAVARRLIDEGRHRGRGSDLVVRDRGGQEVKARNRGEAREAKRHIREFRDMKKREHFKTQIGFRGNNQKHFRDPLLQ